MLASDTIGSGGAGSAPNAPLGFPADYVALDLETTGFYPNSCGITEIGAVRVRGHEIVDRFQRLVNPLKPIPRAVTELTGIDDALVEDCPAIEEVLPRFLDWLDEGAQNGREPIVGHNVTFDLHFLDYETRRLTGEAFPARAVDTMQISRALYPEERHHRLLDLIRRFGIADNEEHRALSDAVQTHQCLEWMRRQTDRHEGRGSFGVARWSLVPAKRNPHVDFQRLTLV